MHLVGILWKARNYEATLLKSRYVSVKPSEINILGLEMLLVFLGLLMLRMNHDLEVKVARMNDR